MPSHHRHSRAHVRHHLVRIALARRRAFLDLAALPSDPELLDLSLGRFAAEQPTSAATARAAASATPTSAGTVAPTASPPSGPGGGSGATSCRSESGVRGGVHLAP